MKTYYFAAFEEVMKTRIFEVAVFEDKEARDKWVAFQDHGSIVNGETENNCQLHRIALDDVDAEYYYEMLENCNREADLLNDNMFWITR